MKNGVAALFDDYTKGIGWNEKSQIDVLLGFINSLTDYVPDVIDDFVKYIVSRVDEEINADD